MMKNFIMPKTTNYFWFDCTRHKYATLKEPLYKLNVKDNISTKFIMEQDYYAKCVRNNKVQNKWFNKLKLKIFKLLNPYLIS